MVDKLLNCCHVRTRAGRIHGAKRDCGVTIWEKLLRSAEYFSRMGNDLGHSGDRPRHQVRVMHKHVTRDGPALGPDRSLFHLHSK